MNRGVDSKMNDELIYSEQWNVSSKYFYDKGYYAWMADKLTAYKIVLEVGCGTGYSTLALVERGYKVIAVDKNPECLEKAKALLGWQATRTLSDMCRDAWNWQQKNPDGFI